jgi:hypothetical protein
VVQGQHGRDRLHGAGAPEQVPGHGLGRRHGDVPGRVAERDPDRHRLGDVADRRRRGVGIEMPDVRRLQVAVVEGVAHRRDRTGTRWVGLGDVVRVGADPGAGELGVDAHAARLGVFSGLQHDHAGALAEDESVASLVVGTARSLRLVVALRQRHHVGERGQRQRVDGSLGAAGDDDVRAAVPDHVQPVGERLRTRGTGADRRVDAGPGAELQTHVRRGTVRHEHRDRQRGHPAWAGVAQRVVVGQQGGDPADARRTHHAQPVAVDLLTVEAGVGPRLLAGDDGKLPGAVEAARLNPREHFFGLDGDPRSDAHGKIGRPVLGEGADAGAAGHEGFPGGRDVAPDGRGRAEPGDDDTSLGGHGLRNPASR